MSEELIPQPPPQSQSYWDPTPPRCPECREIIDVHPASRADGEWEGWCQFHGMVVPVYASQDSEMDEEEEVA